jgi:hypothetical protein
MSDNLQLAVWLKEEGSDLGSVERLLLSRWRPPLNLKDVETPWKAMLNSKRKLMSEEARRCAG